MRYDQAISELQTNQKSVISKLNEEISLTNQIIQNYNETLFLLQSNQNTISQKLKEIDTKLNKLIFDFEQYLKLKDLLDQIEIIIGMIEQILTDLENSVTFSHLNTLNFKIINNKDLMKILEQAQQIYGIEMLPFPLEIKYLMNFYEISETASYFSNLRITFVIKIPIVSQETFNYFHLFSVPNINKSIIIPPYPFLLTNGNEYYGLINPCQQYNEWYFCNQEEYPISIPSCIQEILEIKSQASCPTQKINLKEEKLQSINSQHHILITPEETKVTEICDTTTSINLKGSFLITIQPTCSIKTFTNTIMAEIQETGTPIILPTITINNAQTSEEEQHLLELDDVKLDQLRKIQPIQQLKYETVHWTTYSTPTITLIVIMMVITTIFFVYRRWRRKTTRNQKIEIELNPLKKEEKKNISSETPHFFAPSKC